MSFSVVENIEAGTLSLLQWWRFWDKRPFSDLGQKLRREYLLRWLPYDNRPVLVLMYGRQIEIMLESYRSKRWAGTNAAVELFQVVLPRNLIIIAKTTRFI